ncbi:MAG TPA: hypothetical protein VD978_16350 [Azospirillum sp.]|nr:hypothetical protein [Azospirillum sp.]
MAMLAVMLLSAGILAYEVLLVRLFAIIQWHHFAYMIISVALLGFGASGTFVTLARGWLEPRFTAAFVTCALSFAAAAPGGFAVAQAIPFNALEIVWDLRQIPYLLAIYAVLIVPFFCGATGIILALSQPRAPVARIYAADLIGAGVGAFGIMPALSRLHPLACLELVAALGLLAAACAGGAAHRTGFRALAVALTVAGVLLPVLPTGPWLALNISPYKGLSAALEIPEANIVAERSGPLGLLDVVASPRIPFRHAPGLSLNTTAAPPEQLGLFTDAEAMSPITAFDGDTAPLAYLDFTTAALPYHLKPNPEVLVLGAGGGAPILLALHHQAARVDAVELNPQVVELVDETFGRFSGRIYSRPPVHLHPEEARSFVAGTAQRYDVINLPPQGSFGAAVSGAHGLGESYVDTVDAFRAYLDRLAPGGFLTATHWVTVPPRDALKLFATARLALEQNGVAEPGQRLAMLRGWQTVTLIVKNGDLTAEDCAAVRAFAEARSFDLVHLPGMTAAEANRFNRLDQDDFHAGAQALLGPDRDAFIARYKFDLRPATDDRPYFGDFFRWRALPEILALRAPGGAGLLEWGYLVLAATLVQAALLGGVLILLPVAVRGLPASHGEIWWTAGYFLSIGLAFLFIEIAFIQRFTLFLGNPLHAVSTCLAGFLVFAGIGSAVAPYLVSLFGERPWKGRLSPIGVVTGMVALVAVLYLVALPALLDRLVALPAPLKVAVALVLIAPLAVPMGMPFPLGLSHTAPALVPWAWAINGSASVLSAVLATMLAREFGFRAVVISASLLYGAAAAAARSTGSAEAKFTEHQD